MALKRTVSRTRNSKFQLSENFGNSIGDGRLEIIQNFHGVENEKYLECMEIIYCERGEENSRIDLRYIKI